MDTLSAPISTFNISIPTHNLHRKSNELHRFPPFISSTTTAKPRTNKVSNRTTPFINNLTPLLNSSQAAAAAAPQLKQTPNPSHSHQKASTGYAVALLDTARHHNALERVERDVKRLSKWLRNDLLHSVIIGNHCEKGEILKEVVKKGRFDKHLLRLVNLLIEKNKVGMLSEVLIEFAKIYDELVSNVNDQVVFVSSEVKMDKKQVFGIARSVQNLTGAVKVTVRQLVDKRLPSFAV